MNVCPVCGALATMTELGPTSEDCVVAGFAMGVVVERFVTEHKMSVIQCLCEHHLGMVRVASTHPDAHKVPPEVRKHMHFGLFEVKK